MHHLRLMVLLTLLLIATSVIAQDNEAADRALLLEILDSVELALNEQRFDELTPLLDDDVVAIFLDGEVTRTPAGVTAYIDKFLGGDAPLLKSFTTSADIGDSARFFGDIAVAHGTSKDVFDLADGSQININSLWSVTLSKDSGNWKIAQLHISTNVFDNPIVAAANERFIIIVTSAVVVGLIIGLLLGRLTGRG